MPELTPSKLRKLRLQLGYSQEQLAQRIGVSWVTLNRWENGHHRPSPLALTKLLAIMFPVMDKSAPVSKPARTKLWSEPPWMKGYFFQDRWGLWQAGEKVTK